MADTIFTYKSRIPTYGGGQRIPYFQTFEPNQVAGLNGWYIGNTGITITGSGISQWADQSGTGNHFVQTTDADRPTHSTDRVVFDASNFLTATSAQTYGAIFAVMTPSGLQSYGSLLAFTDKHCFIRFTTTANFYVSAGSLYGAAGAPSFGMNLRYNGVDATFVAVNSYAALGTTKKVFTTSNSSAATSKTMILGKDVTGGAAASGDIYEIITYSAKPSAADIVNIENYLMRKYGL